MNLEIKILQSPRTNQRFDFKPILYIEFTLDKLYQIVLSKDDIENMVVNFNLNGDFGLMYSFGSILSKYIPSSIFEQTTADMEKIKYELIYNIPEITEAHIDRETKRNSFKQHINKII